MHVQEKEGVYTVWAGKAEIKRPLGRSHSRRNVISKWNLKKYDECVCVDWIHVAHDGNQQQVVVNTTVNGRFTLPLPRDIENITRKLPV
jgi:hypothetical protein